MNTITLKLQKDPDCRQAGFEVSCPYCNIETEICMAALSTMRLGPTTRLTYCDNENYDYCPVLLAKILRRR